MIKKQLAFYLFAFSPSKIELKFKMAVSRVKFRPQSARMVVSGAQNLYL